jgi:hypothetical protein
MTYMLDISLSSAAFGFSHGLGREPPSEPAATRMICTTVTAFDAARAGSVAGSPKVCSMESSFDLLEVVRAAEKAESGYGLVGSTDRSPQITPRAQVWLPVSVEAGVQICAVKGCRLAATEGARPAETLASGLREEGSNPSSLAPISVPPRTNERS